MDWSKRAARLVSPPWSLWEWVLFVGAHGDSFLNADGTQAPVLGAQTEPLGHQGIP